MTESRTLLDSLSMAVWISQVKWSSPRPFRLWRYIVSHRSLLIRSQGGHDEPNTDIMFTGVFYQELPASFQDITFSPLTSAELEYLKGRCDPNDYSPNRFCCLASGGRRYYIGASHLRVEENTLHHSEDNLLA